MTSATSTESLLARFLRYVRIDTQADETSSTYPSTAKQLDLSRLLHEECRDMGLADISITDDGIVYATIPATPGCDAPTIAWFAHVDTSPETSGTNVQPIVHADYQGGDIVLPADTTRVIRVSENPVLECLKGATLVTTDGTTLLGGDDKAGIAVILTAAERLLAAKGDIEHGPIRICFTCDEEIGHGTDKIDMSALDTVCGYTLDGEGTGKIDGETFSADLATVHVRGINTHPSMGKDKMVNAVRILAQFLAALPAELSPERTEGRNGFLHPYQMSGGVADAQVQILLRDFETPKLAEYAEQLEAIAAGLRKQHPKAEIHVDVKRQYRNMRDGMEREPRAMKLGIEALRAAGLDPEITIIRGGTDGSALTEKGLPTPNLSSGQHNPHSPLEWTSVEEMDTCVRVLIELARLWGRESA